MKAELITHWDGEKLFRPIAIFWWRNKEYKGMNLAQAFYRRLSNLYYSTCWWLYEHSGHFREIPEAQRFSWKYFSLGGK